jgi:uncharacterized protein (DUF924 family)
MSGVDMILEFWFDGVTDQTLIQKNKPPFSRWFAANAQFDKTISDRFELDFLKAQRGEYKAWEVTPRGLLALLLLFDQFSRNMYRNTPKMYATDHLAVGFAHRLINEGADRSLTLIERMFAYMPLMHSEHVEDQELSVRSFERLVGDAKLKNPKNVPYYESNLAYARKYLDTIRKFGRFPYRNAVLKRSSTDGEKQFLKNRA